MRIAILGCGPSGLAAAHASREFGHAVSIYSTKVKSPIYGAQYLHGPIPGCPNDDPIVIRYLLDGTPEDYLRKVYGDSWDGTVSDEMRSQAFLAWNIRSAYDWLWKKYGAGILNMALSNRASTRLDIEWLEQIYDLVINTIPRPSLCVGNHTFRSTKIWAVGDDHNGGCPVKVPDNVIQYNGREQPTWYRAARMFGYSTVEWPGWMEKPPLENVVKVAKPLGHNCNCFPAIKHLGRMGKWQMGELVHQVYPDMAEILMIQESGM